jgi:hypothetical protein
METPIRKNYSPGKISEALFFLIHRYYIYNMKIVIALLLLFVSASVSATIRVSACTRDVCTEYVLTDVKAYNMFKNPMGNPFLRVVFTYGSTLDISGETVKVSR